MKIVFSLVLLVGGVAWIWGSMSGRLANMIAALVQPSWLVPPPSTGSTAGSNPTNFGPIQAA